MLQNTDDSNYSSIILKHFRKHVVIFRCVSLIGLQ